MKDTEIHTGLDRKEVRDFISKTLVDVWVKTCRVSKITTLNRVDLSPHQYNLEFHRNEAAKHTELANLTQQTIALIEITKACGWDEFDVSDKVTRESPEGLCLNFIGTQEEHDELFRDGD